MEIDVCYHCGGHRLSLDVLDGFVRRRCLNCLCLFTYPDMRWIFGEVSICDKVVGEIKKVVEEIAW